MREDRPQRVEVVAQDRSDFYALERRGSGDTPAAEPCAARRTVRPPDTRGVQLRPAVS